MQKSYSFLIYSFNSLDEVRKRSRVSPEHSEDGNMPPVADHFHHSLSSTAGAPPDVSVPDPLFRSASDDFQIIQKFAASPSLEPTSANLSSSAFLIDEKELADAVSKAMEIPVHAPVAISPIEKKTAKRRRIEAAPTVKAAAVPSLPTGEMTTEQPVKTCRRKDCPEEHERRRERNRVLARKSRQKKKSLFETLQKEVARLNQHNQIMREIITTKMGMDNLDRILEKYAPEPDDDDDSVEHIVESASVSGSDSD